VKVQASANTKTLFLESGSSVDVHRFACVGAGDDVEVQKLGTRITIEAICANGRAKVTPSFQLSRPLDGLGGRLVIREAATDEDLAGFEALARYHYRLHASFGRRAILVAYLEGEDKKRFAGYLEVTNTFAGHKARNRLLDAPFADGTGAKWLRWDREARNKYMNSIARISRCVVHPEYRGVGIGVALCVAAQAYCKHHWHLGKQKPLFLEIIADMLKFVPFAERAGMRFIGTTSGNIDRVRKDQSYMHRVFTEIESGLRDRESHSVFSTKAKSILLKQRGDVEKIHQLAQAQEVDVDQLLAVYLSSSTPEGMSATSYDLLSELLRFPKPTYMCGLSDDASAFLTKRLAECAPRSEDRMSFAIKPEPIDDSIRVRNLTINYEYQIPASGWANAIREAFGINKRVVTATGVTGLSLDVRPRQLVYVWGPSGSGKTGLLEVLMGMRAASSGTVAGFKKEQAAFYTLQFPEKSIIEGLGTRELNESLYCLNLAGLSEAALYFKSPAMLSTGQRHRLGLARLIASRRPVWIVDEFCSVLDDTTAAIVARNLGRVARDLGVTAIIAGPRREPVISSLSPDAVLNLDSLGRWSVQD